MNNKSTTQVIVNVTQENLDYYKNNLIGRPNGKSIFDICPIGNTLQQLFGTHACIAGGSHMKLFPYMQIPSNIIAEFPYEIQLKSMSNCDNGNDKPFSFYIDIPKEWLKECSMDVY